MRHIALGLFLAASGACGSAGRAEHEDHKASATADASTPTDAERAVTFIERAGADSRAEVDWVRVVHSNLLATLADFAKLTKVTGDDPTTLRHAAIADLREMDLRAEAHHAADDFASQWKGASGCRAEVGAPGDFLKLSKDELEALPGPVMATGMQLLALPELRITCGELIGSLVYDADGRVIALRVPKDPAAFEGNRFVNFRNQPME